MWEGAELVPWPSLGPCLGADGADSGLWGVRGTDLTQRPGGLRRVGHCHGDSKPLGSQISRERSTLDSFVLGIMGSLEGRSWPYTGAHVTRIQSLASGGGAGGLCMG